MPRESPPLAKMVWGDVLTSSEPKARKMNGQDPREAKLDRKKRSLPYPNKNSGLEQEGEMVFERGVHHSPRWHLNKTSFLLYQHLSDEFGFCGGRQPNLHFRLHYCYICENQFGN